MDGWGGNGGYDLWVTTIEMEGSRRRILGGKGGGVGGVVPDISDLLGEGGLYGGRKLCLFVVLSFG